MTSPDARQVAEQIADEVDGPLDMGRVVPIITRALSEARRQVWEEAAELARACNTQETEHLYHQLRQRALPSKQMEAPHP